MIDVEAVKSALRATAILDAYGEHYHDAPTIRLTRCSFNAREE